MTQMITPRSKPVPNHWNPLKKNVTTPLKQLSSLALTDTIYTIFHILDLEHDQHVWIMWNMLCAPSQMSQVWCRVLSNPESSHQIVLLGQLLISIQHPGYTLLPDLIGLSQAHPCSKRQIKWITEQPWLLEGQNYCWSCRDPIRTKASLCAHGLNYLIGGISHRRE